MNDMTVWKSNEIVEAGYRLSLGEQRLILLSLGQLDSRDLTQKHVILYAKDFAKAWGVSDKTAIRDLKLASDRLFDRYITLKNDSKIKKFRWIQSATQYLDGQGAVEFTFSDDILPFLFKLEHSLGNFTKYELLNVSGFSSVYSFRLYELAVKMRRMTESKILVEELRRILQVDNKYPEYGEFKRCVISKSLKDINEKSDLLVDIDPIKRGRSIYALRFTIKQKQAQAVSKITKRPPFPHKNKYGKFVKLERTDPKMSSAEYGNYARDCLKILEDFYSNIEDVPNEDLRNYWVFLETNASNRSKLGKKQDFLDELNKRGFKLINCELVKND
ncbi:replication protein RepA (plasmid) [Gallibacterium anatis UMN179]|uniref:Replication protein RepA n=1 Tax=Gallibacterium anatis (strain UMN179) TaxID=1005058 RepID=F4HFW8_GALAU|nr:replication initiation protein [Gallibacterium anatis]AEC18535.1 replication protein RepA [Gallibacterium anatis UMN179]